MKSPRMWAGEAALKFATGERSISVHLGPLEPMFTAAMDEARATALEMAAQHVDAQLTMARSGMPADMILHAICTTLRSADFRALLATPAASKPPSRLDAAIAAWRAVSEMRRQDSVSALTEEREAAVYAYDDKPHRNQGRVEGVDAALALLRSASTEGDDV